MKKFLLFIFFLGCLPGLQAQTSVYHPFPKSNAVWINARGTYNVITFPYHIDYYPEPSDNFCLPGTDTLIGSYNYSKIYRCGGAYKGALRDDSVARKVYFIPADSASELLIYDFSVQNGDTAFVYDEEGPYTDVFTPVQHHYVYTDSVLINGNYRKRVKFGDAPGMWIEGIGGTQGLFREAWANVSNYYTSLDCMSHADTTLYPTTSIGPCSLTEGIATTESSDALKLYPNPTTGTCTIETGQNTGSTVEIKDVLGNTVLASGIRGSATIDLSGQAPGIYFVAVRNEKQYRVLKLLKQ